MADLDRWSGRDREGRDVSRAGNPSGGELRLAFALRREGRVALALETALGDPRGLAVPEQDERRIQAVGNERGGSPGCAPRAQRSPPSRIVQRSISAS